jgi:argininosuccinate lyase
MEEYKQFSELFEDDIYTALDPQNVVNARNVLGGTAKNQVESQVAAAGVELKKTQQWVKDHLQKIEVQLL